MSMSDILKAIASLAIVTLVGLAFYVAMVETSAVKPSIQPHTVKVCSMQEDGTLVDCTTHKALDFVRPSGAKYGEWK